MGYHARPARLLSSAAAISIGIACLAGPGAIASTGSAGSAGSAAGKPSGPLPAFAAAALAGTGKFKGPKVSRNTRIRKAIAKAAISQIGKLENPDKCGGRNNCYPKRYKLNGQILRPAEWCGVFTYWAWTTGKATKKPPMSGSGKRQGHWATYWQKWGKDKKRWKKRTKPQLGDAVVYGNYPGGWHVGVVVGVRKNGSGKVTHVRTVEGNIPPEDDIDGDQGVVDRGWRSIRSLDFYGYKSSGFVSPVKIRASR